jgi:hypothetical protein
VSDPENSEDLLLLRRAVTLTVALMAKESIIYLHLPSPLPNSARSATAGNHPWDKWVPVRFEVDAAADALAFVTEVATWLDVEVPRVEPAEVLASFNWFNQKLTLERAGDHAEVYLNLLGDGGDDEESALGRIVVPESVSMCEKDEAYREDFVRLLAEALLDGATDV